MAGPSNDPALVPLGGLALSVVRPLAPMLVLRAAKWHSSLERLGVTLPFFVAHDLGLLYAAPEDQMRIGPRTDVANLLAAMPAGARQGGSPASLAAVYATIIDEIAKSDPSQKARALRLGDDLITVILARLLSALFGAQQAGHHAAAAPLDVRLPPDFEAALPDLFRGASRSAELQALEVLARGRLHLLTLADAIDLDTLRLLGMLGAASTAASALAQVDLLAAMSSPAANDIVSFSLELLPSVLETRRSPSAGTHAKDGYAGLGTQGSLDSMLLTELAWDDVELARRFLDNEILYYTREQARDETRRLHYILVDASASMRGERQVFARGLAIALGKKLQLAGEDVWLRFFDSRLYEVQKARGSTLPVAYLLGFKGERGRNPARVFAQLATEVALLRTREQRDPLIHLVTHAALHVPRPLVAEIRRHARLTGIFILPSGGRLDLDYLDLLESHSVVDHATLRQKPARAAAASKIVQGVGARRDAPQARETARGIEPAPFSRR